MTVVKHDEKKEIKKQKKKDDSDVATGMAYGVASLLSWSKSIYYPKTGKIRGLPKTIASFRSCAL